MWPGLVRRLSVKVLGLDLLPGRRSSVFGGGAGLEMQRRTGKIRERGQLNRVADERVSGNGIGIQSGRLNLNGCRSGCTGSEKNLFPHDDCSELLQRPMQIQLLLSREPDGRPVICHGSSVTASVIVRFLNYRTMQLTWQSIWQVCYRLDEMGAIMSFASERCSVRARKATCRASPHQLEEQSSQGPSICGKARSQDRWTEK